MNDVALLLAHLVYPVATEALQGPVAIVAVPDVAAAVEAVAGCCC